MSTLRTILVFSGVATGLALLASAVSGVVKAQVDRARNELFEIGPGCEWIEFKGIPDAGDDEKLDAHFARARTYYFGPLIAQLKAQGLNLRQIRVAVLEDLFPTCKWPPKDMLSTKGVIWMVLGRWVELEAMRGDICDPLQEPPAGMLCVERGGAYVLERKNV